MEEFGLGEGSLPAMWWDIQGITWMECIWSHGVEIFHQRGQLIEVSPYIHPPLGVTSWHC